MPELDRSLFAIRTAQLEEAVILADCAHQSYRMYVERIGQHPAPMLEDYVQLMQRHQVWVAEYNGEVVGFIVLKLTLDGLLLDNVAVVPRFQGQGIGRLLLEHGEEQAKRQGLSSMYLYTHEKMLENQAMYAKNGYVEYERREQDGFSRVFMRKTF